MRTKTYDYWCVELPAPCSEWGVRLPQSSRVGWTHVFYSQKEADAFLNKIPGSIKAKAIKWSLCGKRGDDVSSGI